MLISYEHKEKLLDEFFSIGANNNVDHNKTMRKKLLDYKNTHEKDLQIEDALRILDIWEKELNSNDFEASFEIAAPIIKRLPIDSNERWDFYDIRILASVIDYAGTYVDVYNFSKKLLNELEKHSRQERYLHIKLAIYGNASFRLLRAKYFDSNNLVPSRELEKWFSEYIGETLFLCERLDLQDVKAMFQIRKGLFYHDEEMVIRGFSKLKELESFELYRMTKDEADEYKFFQNFEMSKTQINKIIGASIRKRRKALGLTQEKLGKMTQIHSTYISKMEVGAMGVPAFDLFKISCALVVSADYFFQEISGAPGSDNRIVQLKVLEEHTKNFTDAQMDYLLMLTKSMPNIV